MKTQSWSEPDGQVFFNDDQGWGLTENLATICLGKEHDIKHFFETGKLKVDLQPKQQQILNEIMEYRKELLNGKSEGIKPKSSHTQRAVRTSGIRTRPTSNAKHKQVNTRYTKARKGTAIR